MYLFIFCMNTCACVSEQKGMLTHAHRFIGYRNRNPQRRETTAFTCIWQPRYLSPVCTLPVPILLAHTHTAPSPRPRSSRSHALRYFGFLSVWPGLQFPTTRPLGLDLLYVYPRNPVCARHFKILLFQCLLSHYTDTHFYILSVALALLL